jgi:hypothetical protein
MNEVTRDLKALASLELPPAANKTGRNIVKVTILCFSITILAALGTVTYALFASLNRESSLKQELGCVRASAVLVDQRVGEGLAVVIDNNNTLLFALDGVAKRDEEQLRTALGDVPQRVKDGATAQSNLDHAIQAREQALNEC